MTIIGKSMFPLQNGIRNITDMKVRFDQLQLQLATGKKASNLAQLGTDRFFDLSMRARMAKLESFGGAMTTVNLRLDVLGSTMARLDSIESDQRGLVTPGGYGSSGINLATAPELSKARLDEVLNLLNTSIDGRYLFGGSTTDKMPVGELDTILNGGNGKAGFITVQDERTRADLGDDGLGRLSLTAATDTVTLTEDGAHPFGFKLSTLRTNSAAIGLNEPAGDPATLDVQFTGVPEAGDKVHIGLTLPDGTETTVTLTAGEGAGGPGSFATSGVMATAPFTGSAAGPLTINGDTINLDGTETVDEIAALVNEAEIGVTASVGVGSNAGRLIFTSNTQPAEDVIVTAVPVGAGLNLPPVPATSTSTVEFAAATFAVALDASLREAGKTTLTAASNFAAADNFFNGQGEPVLRVAGPPLGPAFAEATELKVASATDTVFWYEGGTQGIKAEDMGRLTLGTTGATTTLGEMSPLAADYGFKIAGVTGTLTNTTITPPAGLPNLDNGTAESLSVAFTGAPVADETLTISLELPNGATRDITVRAVSGPAGTGEFSIGGTPDETAANFEAALRASLEAASAQAAGSARESVRSQVDDGVHVNYGVQANENGMLELVRTLAAMSAVTFANGDESAPKRFDAMAARNLGRLNEGHNNEKGSLEVIAVQLGLAQAAMGNIAERHTAQKAQLANMLTDLEGAPAEEVAMEILALKTRLEASYQTTSMIAQMSLVNYL